MKIRILDKDSIAEEISERIVSLIKEKPNAVLGLATGSSPLGVYQKLIEKYRSHKVSFKNCITINLDEYEGLDGSNHQSYRYFMNVNLLNHIDIDKKNTYVPSGIGDLEENCKAYERLIEENPIDFQILGIGSDGHIAFNEPGTPFSSLTHVTTLKEKTIKDNSRFFSSIDEVPTKAITEGLSTIMKAKEIVLIATGKNKASAIRGLVYGQPSENNPCSVLQSHPNVIIYVDDDAFPKKDMMDIKNEMRIDKGFVPAISAIRDFERDVISKGKSEHIGISIERNDGYVYRKEYDIFKEGVDDERNIFMTERIIKTILWIVGGYKIYISGPHYIYQHIKDAYHKGGIREFDYDFMSTVYENEMQVIECSYDELPKIKSTSLPYGGHLRGRRIGFDAGGSDRKVSAVLNGNVIFSNETIWFPKDNSDPHYHINGIYESMKMAIDKLGGDVDAIGISSAGVYVNNKAMVASLFRKVGKEDYEKYIKNIYGDIVARLEKELGHHIPYAVANDGDVTALAGSLDLHSGNVLGIAMGTSEAVGYVDEKGNINGWLSEDAFAPVDFNKSSQRDDWSMDFGVGATYFSQDAVIKLAKMGGIELDESLSPAEKLEVVQKLNEEGNPIANDIFTDIGTYLAYALAYYDQYYSIRHVILMGRVVSGKGGETILARCREVLKQDFPELSYIEVNMPSEHLRRVGQSIAASSLAE